MVVDWAGRIGNQDGKAVHDLIGRHGHALEVAPLSGQHLGLDGPDRNRRHRPEGHSDGASGSVHYKGKNIAEVLEMPISEAAEFFEPIQAIHRYLKTLVDVGLGYVRLGQSATTLSGGEAQRVKLATELQRRSNGRSIYVLDEPTTGLAYLLMKLREAQGES